ncbi:IclR family transcriptional regulator [Pseudoroseomonas deserti]|uniref:IclR family transcriptional regulator n=1 Tax=Teichococcus deserti TaxID=1817963 RepID=A0A1V2H0U5_9PROT|nr:IclR family transcriptional regulator [Pseudoroseomonas deserti]
MSKANQAAAAAPDPRLFVQAVDKAMRVLEAFAQRAEPLSLAEIAGLAGLDRSGAQRLCYTLRHLGYLELEPGGRGHVPGLRLLDRSYDLLRMHPLVQRATSPLIELRRATQERVDLSLPDDVSIVYAVRLQSKRENFIATLVGRRLPAFCSSGGRAMLAQLDDARVEDILARSDRRPFTPKSIVDIPALRGKIAEARALGHAFALEERLLGEVVLAAAITDRGGEPIGAIHIAGSLAEWEPADFQRRMAPLAMETARALSG